MCHKPFRININYQLARRVITLYVLSRLYGGAYIETGASRYRAGYSIAIH